MKAQESTRVIDLDDITAARARLRYEGRGRYGEIDGPAVQVLPVEKTEKS